MNDKKKKELLEKIENAKDMEELRSLQSELDSIKEEEKKAEEEKKKIEEERSILRKNAEEIETTNDIEKRNLIEANKIEKPGEERKRLEENNKVLEERGQDLKDGKLIKVDYEDRAVTISSGSVLVEKKYKRDIDESFQRVSALVDRTNSIQLDGGDSYSVSFEKSYGEGDGKNEGEEYADVEPVTDYVDTGRAKITAYTEITKELAKLPNANYQALVVKRVRDAIRKKLGKQIITGTGTANTIKGIYNADEKVLPKSAGADIELTNIDEDTLNKIVFAYGGDESIEDEQELVLNKRDIEAFSKIKDASGRFVYKIARNGQTGKIGYSQGGVEVPYTINSACKALSDSTTGNGEFTMVYGALSSYELPIFSPLEIEESRDYQFKKGIIAYRGDVIVGGTVSKYKGFVRIKKKIVKPEISNLTVTPVSGLKAPLEVETKIADLNTIGGEGPYTYSLKSGGDNTVFKIDQSTVKVKTKIETEGTKNITVIVTDKNKKTKEQNAKIVISAAGV